ncbi:hypothetical protein [Desulfonatronospira sp.]|uniref:hypothetical protein n=1 Tax=Desulfonatronospira sp. TaxID=1962951 RepID=UPI0025C00C64|nr:hypothetical protein [Desulfonatronospira sp.]
MLESPIMIAVLRTLIGLAVGFILGLIPYFFGYINRLRRHAFAGLILCTVSGAIGGYFGGIIGATGQSLGIAIIFSVVILFKK